MTIRGPKVWRESMYSIALETFKRLDEGRIQADGVESALASFKEPLRFLRPAYGSDRVIVTYDLRSQLAYLLAYVPSYIRMAEDVIRRSLSPRDVGESLRVGLVGAGPAPEAVAMVNLLLATHTPCTRLELHVFDVAEREWSEVRRWLLQVGCCERWGGIVEVHEHVIDLGTLAAFRDHRPVLAELDLVMVQNCLNEAVASGPEVMVNLQSLVASIGKQGVLAISDQYRYALVRELLKALAEQIEGSAEVLGRFEEQLDLRVVDRLPVELTNGGAAHGGRRTDAEEVGEVRGPGSSRPEAASVDPSVSVDPGSPPCAWGTRQVIGLQAGLFDEQPRGPGLHVQVHRAAFFPAEADQAFRSLRDEVPWQQDEIIVFGKRVPQPRLTAWFGDEGLEYMYSGITMQPLPWTDTLDAIRARVEGLAAQGFNTVLLNLYRHGKDGVAWHADDEADLGRQPVIASVSLGATRRFQLRRRDDPSVKREFELHHGDVVIMRGTTQELWQHQVPKTAKQVGERINLTFRTIVTSEGAEP